MNAPVEIEQLQSVRATHRVSARGQFHQKFFQNTRVAVAYLMQFSKMLRRIGLNVSLGNGLPNELFSLVDRQWRKVETRELVQVLPEMANLIGAIRAARNPDRNLLADKRDEPGYARLRMFHMIERNRFAAAHETGK